MAEADFPLSTLPHNQQRLLQARIIVRDTLKPEGHARCSCRAEIMRGAWDHEHTVRAAMMGLNRGEALARRRKADRESPIDRALAGGFLAVVVFLIGATVARYLGFHF